MGHGRAAPARGAAGGADRTRARRPLPGRGGEPGARGSSPLAPVVSCLLIDVHVAGHYELRMQTGAAAERDRSRQIVHEFEYSSGLSMWPRGPHAIIDNPPNKIYVRGAYNSPTWW
eukprot:COSAG01_NODE_2541_length_7477_cov_3.164226_5_plen_116_part_00